LQIAAGRLARGYPDPKRITIVVAYGRMPQHRARLLVPADQDPWISGPGKGDGSQGFSHPRDIRVYVLSLVSFVALLIFNIPLRLINFLFALSIFFYIYVPVFYHFSVSIFFCLANYLYIIISIYFYFYIFAIVLIGDRTI